MSDSRTRSTLLAAALLASLALPAWGQEERPGGKVDPDGLTMEDVRKAFPEYDRPSGDGRVGTFDIPDVFGPGAVLNVGNLFMKVTNFGHCGNFFTNLSSDPAGTWPGASGVEYLSTIRLAIGAKNPDEVDPVAIRRVSYLFEWRPPSLAPEDRIYRAYDGIINGARYTNDDNDGPDRFGNEGPDYIDEDFLDGRDNDGNNGPDEDFGALGQQMYSCVMRDDTPQAINATFNEKHVPLGLEVRQLAWAYSIPGFTDFDVIEYTVFNRSPHELDSLTIGWLVDLDCGPVGASNFFLDDFDLPYFPHGEFRIPLDSIDPRRQTSHDPALNGQGGISENLPLCEALNIRINGFSVADDEGDNGRTAGIASFLLIDHTVDPLGINGPWRVGFHAYRSFTAGTPFIQGGNPIIDQQRFEFLTMKKEDGGNVDYSEDPADASNPEAPKGWITQEPGDQKGDFVAWCSTGPWRHIPPGGRVQATVAFAVKNGKYPDAINYRSDYQAYEAGQLARDVLQARYPVLDNAIAAQVARAGIWEVRPIYPVTDYHGRETPLVAPFGGIGFSVTEPGCETRGTEPRTVFVSPNNYSWFDFDCDYCTGIFDWQTQQGFFHKVWNAEAPPPNPNTNMATSYNYTDNPNRQYAPTGDRTVTIAWDNLSETTPDPKSKWFDFRGYKVWKVANWTRPVGSTGPAEDDWSLLGEFRKFEYRRSDGSFIPDNRYFDPDSARLVCPKVYIPNVRRPGKPDTSMILPICLELGDLWNRQTGQVIKPTPMPCLAKSSPGNPADTCETGEGLLMPPPDTPTDVTNATLKRYPIGRYYYVDDEVKNGFLYFYSVTAFDSTGRDRNMAELNGRRSAVESEGVSPQIGTRPGKSVWVVPNPYRGYARIQDRPSSWDLTPNASDPTGTHIDFMGLPAGNWTIRIYTVSGDLVNTLRSSDAVNESIRPPITDQDVTRPGYNRQQDIGNDGQARWNLISRNGQDIVSGIYIFTVESSEGIQRGKFVIIR